MRYRNQHSETGSPHVIDRLLILLAIAVFTLPAAGETLVGLKLGSMSVNNDQASRPTNYAIHVIRELDTLGVEASIVGEVNRSFDSGKARNGESLEFESNGVYLMFKTHRRLFASASIGYVENRIIAGDDRQSDRGFAYGGGIGVAIGRTRVHLQYTTLADDAEFLSLSLDYWM